jgi:hypothetical protein
VSGIDKQKKKDQTCMQLNRKHPNDSVQNGGMEEVLELNIKEGLLGSLDRSGYCPATLA